MNENEMKVASDIDILDQQIKFLQDLQQNRISVSSVPQMCEISEMIIRLIQQKAALRTETQPFSRD